MSELTKVGGELEKLWFVAEQALPKVDNLYIAQYGKVSTHGNSTDTDKFGPCHPLWAAATSSFADALSQTGGSLRNTSDAIRVAINEYTQVDEGNAQQLNEYGKALKESIGDDKPVAYDGEWTGHSTDTEVSAAAWVLATGLAISS